MRELAMISLMIIYSRYVINNSIRNINNLRYADDTTLMAESEEELKSFLMRVKEESEKPHLKLNIQKIMASNPITSWYREGEKVEAVTDFMFLGSKISSDGDYSRKIKTHLLLGRKTMTNLDSILKNLGYHFANKGPSRQSFGFTVIMYRYESWTIKMAECRSIGASDLWCYRRILRVPWTARRSYQSILKEINLNIPCKA